MYQLIALGAISGMQMLSGMQQAEAIREQSRIQRYIDDMNADFKELDAWEAEKYGYTQASRYQTVIDQTVGEQRVALAYNGVDVSSGTASELQAETRVTGMLNQLDMITTARKQAYGLKMDASNIRLGSYMAGSQAAINASSAQTQGFLAGAATGVKAYGAYASGKAGITTPSSNTGYSFDGLSSVSSEYDTRFGHFG